MPEVPNHSLDNEFPESRDIIHQLNDTDPEFAQMAAEYHDLDRQIRTLERNEIPTTDEHFEELKLQRLQLKDKLYAMIKNSQRTLH